MAKIQNYDSDFCGSLPLHHINVIQDYGFLLVLENESLKIIQLSENCSALFNKPATEIIGSTLSAFADVSQLEIMRQRLGSTTGKRAPFVVYLGNQKMQALAHFKPDYLLIELEKPGHQPERTFSETFEEIKYAMTAVNQAATIEDVSRAAVHELRLLTGFDGIMMYKFDADWNGTVIAEEKVESGLENYLGHTFPASDVPKQARQLYLQNPYRLIPDRSYQPVQLYPVINPVTNTFIDMADCNLRGVAAVHLEYLKNMNVAASMSIRVIHQGKLWGLIACHHLTPHYLSLELCAVCELLSEVISNKISTLLYKEHFDREADLQRKQTAITAQVYQEHDLIAGLVNDEQTNIISLFNAGGAALMLHGQLSSTGKIPEGDFIDNMILWLQNKNVARIFATDNLPELYEEAAPYADIASGALAIPINPATGDYLICFRPEVVRTIKWGGNPNSAINFEPGTKNYHPRNSFDIWQQTVRQTSVAWSAQEIETAEYLRSFIFEFITQNNSN